MSFYKINNFAAINGVSLTVGLTFTSNFNFVLDLTFYKVIIMKDIILEIPVKRVMSCN